MSDFNYFEHSVAEKAEGKRKTIEQLGGVAVCLCPVDVRDVDDQGIVGRTALCGVDLLCRLTVQRIAAKSVDRFGREDDKTAFADAVGSTAQALLFGFGLSRFDGEDFSIQHIRLSVSKIMFRLRQLPAWPVHAHLTCPISLLITRGICAFLDQRRLCN